MGRRRYQPPAEPLPDLNDFEFDILCRACDAGQLLELADFAEWISPLAFGPRTAETYARDSLGELLRLGFVEQCRQKFFRITKSGREWLASTAPLAQG